MLNHEVGRKYEHFLFNIISLFFDLNYGHDAKDLC